MQRRLVIAALLGLALIALACSSGGEPGAAESPSQDLTRSSEVDGITVEARWLTQGDLGSVEADVSAYPPGEYVLLELKLDTHAGDLNEIDLEGTAALRQGTEEVTPAAWVSESDDSHHRSGVLVFAGKLADGEVDLILDIGNEEVVLQWEAAPLS